MLRRKSWIPKLEATKTPSVFRTSAKIHVVDGKTLKVTNRIKLSGHPNNIAVSPDGRRVYVGIIQAPGGVDVIDTASLKRVKTIPTKGTIHNPYVTPDGKYVVAGSIAGKTVNVIDAKTEEPAWTLEDGPRRPADDVRDQSRRIDQSGSSCR